MTAEPAPGARAEAGAASGREAGRAGKRTAILDAALALFVRHGFHATRVEEIAERAGVAKGTVYEYFPSKDDLFQGVLDLSFARYVEAAQEAIRSRTRPGAQLAALIEASLTFAREHRPLARVVLGAMSTVNEHLHEHVPRALAQVRQLFHQVIEAGIRSGEFRPANPHLATSAVLGAVKGLFHQWIFGDPPARTPAEAAAQLHDLLLHGLLAAGGDG